MSPLEQEIVRRKLAIIMENLQALEPIKAMSVGEYIESLQEESR
jgi:hypothetical protein